MALGSKAQDLVRLREMAQLVLDAELARLRRSAQARARLQDEIATLAQPPAAAQADLSPIAAADRAERYGRWLEGRRAELNLALAQRTAAWLVDQARARRAFGRAQALAELARNVAARRRS